MPEQVTPGELMRWYCQLAGGRGILCRHAHSLFDERKCQFRMRYLHNEQRESVRETAEARVRENAPRWPFYTLLYTAPPRRPKLWLGSLDTVSAGDDFCEPNSRTLTLLIEWQEGIWPRHGRGFIFCDPPQPKPVANGPDPTQPTKQACRTTQPNPLRKIEAIIIIQRTLVHKNVTAKFVKYLCKYLSILIILDCCN